ncbi:MAG TPA: tetraacyldisaccharide 4'-kinase, partial [Coxiellaceae bacterium]|nr:tetraacyldisaccharide 4'-kinase [Coxiellaceae bacterium]
TGVPIVVGPNRAESAKQLNMCNVIVSDDGLQHYALERDIEIAIIDGTRKFGNGFCLPAGPLREPQKRLDSVSYVVVNSDSDSDSDSEMRFLIDEMVSICNEKKLLDLSEHKNIIAIAAIGNPERFFSSLKKQLAGNIFVTKIFPDHYHFTKQDFDFVKPDEIIVMTEKDAVKCAAFADERFYQALGHAQLNETLLTSIIKHLHYQ